MQKKEALRTPSVGAWSIGRGTRKHEDRYQTAKRARSGTKVARRLNGKEE